MDHLAAREIGNGVWFIMMASVVVFFGLFLFGRIWHGLTGRQLNLFRATMPDLPPRWLPDWYDRPTQFATGIFFLALGGALRASWVYPYMRCTNMSAAERLSGSIGCPIAAVTAWILWPAMVCAILGGLCLIRIVSPPQWRGRAVLGCLILATGLPAVIYVLF